jgi:hypothetical protein
VIVFWDTMDQHSHSSMWASMQTPYGHRRVQLLDRERDLILLIDPIILASATQTTVLWSFSQYMDAGMLRSSTLLAGRSAFSRSLRLGWTPWVGLATATLADGRFALLAENLYGEETITLQPRSTSHWRRFGGGDYFVSAFPVSAAPRPNGGLDVLCLTSSNLGEGLRVDTFDPSA